MARVRSGPLLFLHFGLEDPSEPLAVGVSPCIEGWDLVEYV